MRWFGRRGKAANRGAASDEPISPKAASLVDEGMLIILSTLRMRVKNELITKLLRDGNSFERSTLLMLVSDGIASLVHEKETAVRYLRATAERAKKRSGIPLDGNDYRKRDVRSLDLRKQVEQGLAIRLREALDDEELLEGIVDDARSSALDEMIRPLRVGRPGVGKLSAERRTAAKEALAAEIAEELAEHRKRQKHGGKVKRQG